MYKRLEDNNIINMGTAHGGGSGEWRQEKVTNVTHYSRPANLSSGSGSALSHDGVVATTDKGNRYLIHSTPGSGVVTTPASGMSSKWKSGESVNTTGIRVQDVFNNASGRTKNPLVNYVTSGTCKRSTSSAMDYAKKHKK